MNYEFHPAERVVISAIMSCRRNPDYWKGRLES